MGFFRREKDVEVVKHGHEAYFEVAGAREEEPVVAFEVIEDDPAPPPDPRWMPRHVQSFPAGPRGSVPVFPTTPTPTYLTPRPVREPRAPERPAVQTEWARRAIGPMDRNRVRGMCSGCGTLLSVSASPRPLRTACPVCGRTRVLS